MGKSDDDDDVVDSDFSIDENDEVKSDLDDEDQPKRKKRGIDTKAYKVLQTSCPCLMYCSSQLWNINVVTQSAYLT